MRGLSTGGTLFAPWEETLYSFGGITLFPQFMRVLIPNYSKEPPTHNRCANSGIYTGGITLAATFGAAARGDIPNGV